MIGRVSTLAVVVAAVVAGAITGIGVTLANPIPDDIKPRATDRFIGVYRLDGVPYRVHLTDTGLIRGVPVGGK